MIKKAMAIAVCLTAVTALSSMTACTEGSTFNPDGKNIYTVRVDGGKGSGDYFEGDICKISAETPEDMQFMYWMSGGEQLSSSEEYLFTVSGDVSIKAIYADEVADAYKEVYKVSVTGFSFLNGIVEKDGGVSGEGTYIEGSTCTLTLSDYYVKNSNFLGWKAVNADGQLSEYYVSASPSYSFEVTADTEVVPVFNKGFTRMKTPGKESARFNGAYLEFNREPAGTDGFVDFTDRKLDYLKVLLYNNVDKTGGPVGWFKLRVNPDNTAELYAEYSDGRKAFDCVGGYGNCFRNTTSMSDHYEFFKTVLGDKLTDGARFYFATQAVAKRETEVEINGIKCELGNSFESELNEVYYYAS